MIAPEFLTCTSFLDNQSLYREKKTAKKPYFKQHDGKGLLPSTTPNIIKGYYLDWLSICFKLNQFLIPKLTGEYLNNLEYTSIAHINNFMDENRHNIILSNFSSVYFATKKYDNEFSVLKNSTHLLMIQCEENLNTFHLIVNTNIQIKFN